MCHSSHILEHLIQEEIRRGLNGVMLTTIQYRTFCVLINWLKTKKLECTKLILSMLLYGYVTWSLIIREERLTVLENGAEENIWTEEG
jgi:hypothetical protein